jgi:hypothetical protein
MRSKEAFVTQLIIDQPTYLDKIYIEKFTVISDRVRAQVCMDPSLNSQDIVNPPDSAPAPLRNVAGRQSAMTICRVNFVAL